MPARDGAQSVQLQIRTAAAPAVGNLESCTDQAGELSLLATDHAGKHISADLQQPADQYPDRCLFWGLPTPGLGPPVTTGCHPVSTLSATPPAQSTAPPHLAQAAPDSQGAGPHPPTPRHPRPWAQRLGGLSANITTLVDTVTRPQQPQPGPGKPEGVQAALRGLFQRQPLGGLGGSRGAAAAATPGPGGAAQVSKPQAAREAGQEPAGPQCEAPSGQSMSAARLKAPAQQAGGSGAGDGPAAEPAHPAVGSAQAAAPGSRPESAASASSPAPPAADSEASSAPCQPSHAGPQTGPQPDLQQQHTRLPPGTLQRLAETGNQWRRQMVINSEGGICALTLCALGDDPQAVCVGHGGAVRSISLVTGAQVSPACFLAVVPDRACSRKQLTNDICLRALRALDRAAGTLDQQQQYAGHKASEQALPSFLQDLRASPLPSDVPICRPGVVAWGSCLSLLWWQYPLMVALSARSLQAPMTTR